MSAEIDNEVRSLVLNSEVAAIPRCFWSDASQCDLNRLNRRKRICDIFLCFVAAPFILLITVVIAIAIKCSSRGRVLFKQERVGKDGCIFQCYKFRTMHDRLSRPNNGIPNITQEEDDRIFRVGQWLRFSNLDELPQIINVLKGEMSLVGPRPYMKNEDKHWERVFDDKSYELRRSVRPGITGLAQINGYRGGTLDVEHMRTRLMFDLLYINSYHLRSDLVILWKTLLSMLKFDTGAH